MEKVEVLSLLIDLLKPAAVDPGDPNAAVTYPFVGGIYARCLAERHREIPEFQNHPDPRHFCDRCKDRPFVPLKDRQYPEYLTGRAPESPDPILFACSVCRRVFSSSLASPSSLCDKCSCTGVKEAWIGKPKKSEDPGNPPE